MLNAIPTDWAPMDGSVFDAVLELTNNFHDAGFFKYEHSGNSLTVLLNPVYFGNIHKYSFNGLNACEMQLELKAAVSPGELSRAEETFEIAKLELTRGQLHFLFSGFDLLIPLILSSSMFRFMALMDGQDYWSLG